MNERTHNDILAAEYVLGTLRGAARRRFESLMEQDPALTAEVGRWQEVLGKLDATDIPIQPPGRVWRTIQLRLPQGSIEPASNQGNTGTSTILPGLAPGLKAHVFQRKWQFASLALAASLVAVLLWPRFLTQNEPAGPLPVAVLASTQPGSAQQMVVSFDERNQKIILTPLNLTAPETGHSLELWLIAENQKPASLGLLEPQGSTVVGMDRFRLSAEVTLAISLEPAGGSPTGQPTGKVLYAGKVGKV